MKIICISGKAGHGKDTAASYIKNVTEQDGSKTLIIHYADLLKYLCTSLFGWNGEKDEAGRTLLQHVGTDIVRKKNQNYWVDFVIGILQMFDNAWDLVIIPDCRFPNEIDRLKDYGFDVCAVRVVRDDFDDKLNETQKNHQSETAMDSYRFDVKIRNTSFPEFYNQLDALIKGIKGEIK